MVATGLSGIIELLRMCSDGYGAKDSEILTGIVQHPAVQQAVVAPALADELGHPDTGRSSQALRGLILLGKLSKGTTAELQAMLDISSVKPWLRSFLLHQLANKYLSRHLIAPVGLKFVLLQLQLWQVCSWPRITDETIIKPIKEYYARDNDSCGGGLWSLGSEQATGPCHCHGSILQY